MTPGLSPNWRSCTLLFCCGAITGRLVKKDKLLWKTVFCYTDLELGMNVATFEWNMLLDLSGGAATKTFGSLVMESLL